MALENTPLQKEIETIFGDGPKKVIYTWSCVIETPDAIFEPLRLLSIDIDRSYNKNYGDDIIITLNVPMGMYFHKLLPNRNNLIIELTRSPITQPGQDSTESPYIRRYKALPIDDNDPSMSAKSESIQDPDLADKQGMLDIDFQLLDIQIEKIRLYQVGGIYTDVIPGDVAKYVLSNLTKSIKLNEEEKLKGVDMVPPDNTVVRKHVILTQGTPPFQVPEVIQRYNGGIYKTGISCYLQDGIWYIWPMFNTKRYDLEPKNLTIYNLPSTKMPGVERTFRVSGDGIHVLSTGNSTQRDNSLGDLINKGNGLRFTNPNRIWDGFGETKDNVFTSSRVENNTEVRLIDRDDFNYAPISEDRITDNGFHQISRLAKRNGSVLGLVWENSKIDLLYPGMPVKVVYLENNKIKNRFGVLIKTQHFINDPKKGAARVEFKTNSALTVFVENI